MVDEPPPPPQAPATSTQADVTLPLIVARPNGSLEIDLTQLVPPPADDCAADEPDPFNPEIVVCETTAVSPRLGPQVGPADEGFASAIPRARVRISENAEAQANVINQGVGGFDADGAEVRLKIDF